MKVTVPPGSGTEVGLGVLVTDIVAIGRGEAEVLSMAADNGRSLAGDHVRSAWSESLDIIRETPFTAPWRCAINNTRISFNLLGDLMEVSRDVAEDLSRVNQERKDRLRLLDRAP